MRAHCSLFLLSRCVSFVFLVCCPVLDRLSFLYIFIPPAISSARMRLLDNVREWNFDIDCYLNRVIPPSPLHRLPTPLSRFLGYRREPRQDVGNVCGAIWSFVGAVSGLAVVAAVFNNTESIRWHQPPALIASFGASAVLEYNTVRSALGQPRNALLGHTMSALIGVSVSKLFQMHLYYDSVRWVAGAVACGLSSAVMLLTGTVHPPGGASAVLAATEPAITAMGWYFVGLVMWGTTLMLAVGLIINNLQRQFPMYWWTPLDMCKAERRDEESVSGLRSGIKQQKTQYEHHRSHDFARIEINSTGVMLPGDLCLDEEEVKVLEALRDRLRQRAHTEEEVVALEQRQLRSARSSSELTEVPSQRGMI